MIRNKNDNGLSILECIYVDLNKIYFFFRRKHGDSTEIGEQTIQLANRSLFTSKY